MPKASVCFRRPLFTAVPLAAVILLSIASGCGDSSDDGAPALPHGSFTILTYNVAGLPEGLSGSHPKRYTPLISPKLNGYDLVVVQEDFCYHAALVAEARHPYISPPEYDPGCTVFFGPQRNVGDGLNRFSTMPFSDFERVDWLQCNGDTDCSSDCLTQKGFAVATVEPAPGIGIDVYNLHMDAGSCPGDLEARSTQYDQLIAEIAARSAGRAVIVAGDTNSRPERDEGLPRLLAQAGLVESCQAVNCGDDRIDRVMLRGSDSVELTVESWSLPSEFVDDAGNDLSDHVPVLARIGWAAKAAGG